jgi:hypothetical protein
MKIKIQIVGEENEVIEEVETREFKRIPKLISKKDFIKTLINEAEAELGRLERYLIK